MQDDMSDAPRTVIMSTSEREKRAYNKLSLQKALEGLHQDGLLILQSVVDVDHIDQLNRFMTGERAEILRKKDPNGDLKAYNQGVKCR